MRMRGVLRINFRLEHNVIVATSMVGVGYAECGKSYKSSPTSSIGTFTEESDRITEIRSRLSISGQELMN